MGKAYLPKIDKSGLHDLWRDKEFIDLYDTGHKLLAMYLATGDLREETKGCYSFAADKLASVIGVSESEIHRAFCALIGTSLITWHSSSGTFSIKHRLA